MRRTPAQVASDEQFRADALALCGKYHRPMPEIIIPSGRTDAAYRFALALAGYKLANPNVKIRVVRAPKKRKVKP